MGQVGSRGPTQPTQPDNSRASPVGYTFAVTTMGVRLGFVGWGGEYSAVIAGAGACYGHLNIQGNHFFGFLT